MLSFLCNWRFPTRPACVRLAAAAVALSSGSSSSFVQSELGLGVRGLVRRFNSPLEVILEKNSNPRTSKSFRLSSYGTTVTESVNIIRFLVVVIECYSFVTGFSCFCSSPSISPSYLPTSHLPLTAPSFPGQDPTSGAFNIRSGKPPAPPWDPDMTRGHSF